MHSGYATMRKSWASASGHWGSIFLCFSTLWGSFALLCSHTFCLYTYTCYSKITQLFPRLAGDRLSTCRWNSRSNCHVALNMKDKMFFFLCHKTIISEVKHDLFRDNFFIKIIFGKLFYISGIAFSSRITSTIYTIWLWKILSLSGLLFIIRWMFGSFILILNILILTEKRLFKVSKRDNNCWLHLLFRKL